MIKPDDIPMIVDQAQAWVLLIEQELLRKWPTPGEPWPQQSRYHGATLCRVDDFLPLSLTDAVDDELRARGWRLHRPIDGFSGKTGVPQRKRVIDQEIENYFHVEPDRVCAHYFARPYGPNNAFCKWCGAEPAIGDEVDDANARSRW